jgi:hypothetical protein
MPRLNAIQYNARAMSSAGQRKKKIAAMAPM